MPEVALHLLRVHAGGQRQRGPGVTQVVQADRAQSCSFHLARERVTHGLRVDGLAQRICEHEAVVAVSRA